MPKKAEHPNVIVFLTDQQRWDCSGLHGNPLQLMPTFDRLAQSGTHVSHSFTCQPVCAPARSCLQLGRYATNTGVWKNGPTPDLNLPTVAGVFRDAGYRTSYIGKWHLYDHGDGDPGPVPPEARLGYDRWLASNILEFTSDAYRTRLYDEQNRPVDLAGYRVDACVDAAIARIVEDAGTGRPFFTFVSLLEPHHQNSRDDYPAPYGTREAYEGRWIPPDLAALAPVVPGANPHQHLAGYYAMVRRIDDALGRLYDVLISLGLVEDTILLFTSDHGCHFKTRNSEYKRSLHDASIRVPTMFTGGPFAGGGRLRELVSHVDIPATLIDACRLPVPDSFEGRSIVPLLRTGGADSWPDEVFVQISESEIGRAIRTRRWKYGVRVRGSAEAPVAREQAWDGEFQEAFLYDLAADPHELENLITRESHRELCDSLRERLLARMVDAGEEAPVILAPDLIEPAGQLRVTDVDSPL